MTRTYLLIATLPSSPSPTERTSSHPRKIMDTDCTNSYVLNSGVIEPNLVYKVYRIRCTEMFADYSAEIKIAIFQSVSKRQMTYEDRPIIVGAWRQKLHVLTA